MTREQEQKLSAYIAFEESITHLPGLLDKYPSLRPHFDIFCQQIQLILKNKRMIEESEKITNQYSLIRNSLAKSIMMFSRKITAFALLEELTDLQGLFCYSFEELFLASDEKILEISKLILRKTKEYIVDIAEYGINDASIVNFQSSIDQFISLRNDKIVSDQVSEEASVNISSLLINSEMLYKNKLLQLETIRVNS
jgi:hypothetical protein